MAESPSILREDDDVHALRHVIEDDHAVVERERQVRQTEVVGGGVRQPLDIPHGIVGDASDGAAREGGQFCQTRRAEGGHPTLEFRERIVARERLHAGRSGDPHLPPAGLHPQEGVGGEKTVPADVLAADDALEEAPGGTVVQAGVGRERSEAVGEQPSVDRHEPARPCQIGEAGPVREVRHGRGVGDGELPNCGETTAAVPDQQHADTRRRPSRPRPL